MMKRSMKKAEAEQMVAEAYRMTLGREPDAGGLETYVKALLARDFDGLSLLKELLGSEEAASIRRNAAAFAERRNRLSADAEHIVSDAYQAILGRMPDNTGMTVHVDSLRSGQLDSYDLLYGFLHSPEYESRMVNGVRNDHATQSMNVPEEIVLLIHEMIAARLTEQGCKWVVPPIVPSGRGIPATHVTGLIRTLVMLCETRSGTQRPQ